jgi:hypothetical protein
MANSIFACALKAAAEAQGSTQALAGLLRVPEGTLLRWMSGRAMMPVRAFARLMDILGDHEARHPERPGANAAADPVFTFTLNHLAARCAACAGTEFVQRTPAATLRYSDLLVCRSCHREVPHRSLLLDLATLNAQESGHTRARRRPAAHSVPRSG